MCVNMRATQIRYPLFMLIYKPSSFQHEFITNYRTTFHIRTVLDGSSYCNALIFFHFYVFKLKITVFGFVWIALCRVNLILFNLPLFKGQVHLYSFSVKNTAFYLFSIFETTLNWFQNRTDGFCLYSPDF